MKQSWNRVRGLAEIDALVKYVVCSRSKKLYFEWDNIHNDIAVYDKNGNHLGSNDPVTGDRYKPLVPGRKIKL